MFFTQDLTYQLSRLLRNPGPGDLVVAAKKVCHRRQGQEDQSGTSAHRPPQDSLEDEDERETAKNPTSESSNYITNIICVKEAAVGVVQASWEDETLEGMKKRNSQDMNIDEGRKLY